MSVSKIEVSSIDTVYAATMPVEVLPGEGEDYYVTCPDTSVEKGHKNVKLRWEMITEGWEIIGVHGLPYPIFVEKGKDGLDYKCKDKNSSMTDYKYTVIVGSTTTADVLMLDPTITNGGRF
jgi:hypothetical protein